MSSAAAGVFFCKRGARALLLGSSSSRSSLPFFAARSISSGLIPDPSSSSSGSPFLYSNRRGQVLHISQHVKPDGKRAFLVDTLAIVRGLEAQGIPSKHAEAITSAVTEVLNNSLENVSQSYASSLENVARSHASSLEKVSQSFVSKGEMQKGEMILDASMSKFKSEVQTSLENHCSLLQREIEKLRADNEKIRSELRYEIDKVTAGQRLDLNLERGRIRDELAKQSAETRDDLAKKNAEITDQATKLDRVDHAWRATHEAMKYDVIKYCLGTIVSITALGLAYIRVVM